MLNAKQIATIFVTEIKNQPVLLEAIETAAEKVAALMSDDGAAVAAAQLENEVTSTLMDMTVATVLATLIEEEGGGRSNVSISPMSMDHMHQHYTYAVRNEGMIRHVSITMREDSSLKSEETWREPSNRHGLVDVAPEPYSVDDLKPQAEPKEYNRPLWVVAHQLDGPLRFARAHDRANAERMLPSYSAGGAITHIENRWCLHVECPSSGCNHDPKLMDRPEVTSNS